MISVRLARRFAWCYVLLGVVFVAAAVVAEPGVYHGSLHGKFSIIAAESYTFVSLQAETTPAWHWMAPRNHRYRQAEITCSDWTDERKDDRTIRIDLVGNTWSSGEGRGALNVDELARLITFGRYADAGDAELRRKMQSLLDSFQQMSQGTFLRPQHHGHYTESPIRASYQHFTSGGNWGLTAVFLWCLVWPAYLFVFKPPASSRWFTPRKAFLVTLGLVVVLDLIVVATKKVFSPGAISETMEFLMGVINLPTWLLAGDRAVFSWTGWAFGALGWAVLVSLVVFGSRTRIRRDAAAAQTGDDPPS